MTEAIQFMFYIKWIRPHFVRLRNDFSCAMHNKNLFTYSLLIICWEPYKLAKDQAQRCLKDKNDKEVWHPGSACGYWILKYDNMDYLRLPSEEIIEKW